MDFHKPTALFKEMKLLEYIATHHHSTLPEIAKFIESAVSMVHKYVESLESQGFLLREYHSLKVVYYRITAEGIKRRNYLQINYMREVMMQYQRAQQSTLPFLQSIIDKDFRDILLYGAGEAAGIFVDMIRSGSLALNVVGIVDDAHEKQGTTLKGIPVWSSVDIKDVPHDGIVITSFKFQKWRIYNLI